MMRWKPLIELFGQTELDATTRLLSSGFAAAIEDSTWGYIAKSRSGFDERDIALIAESMTRFVISDMMQGFGEPVELSGEFYLVGSKFDCYEFAQHHSQDFLSSSMFPGDARMAAMSADELMHQSTAGMLYRYKYCFLAGDCFDVGYISKWCQQISRKRKNAVTMDEVMKLFEVFKATIETDEPITLDWLQKSCRLPIM